MFLCCISVDVHKNQPVSKFAVYSDFSVNYSWFTVYNKLTQISMRKLNVWIKINWAVSVILDAVSSNWGRHSFESLDFEIWCTSNETEPIQYNAM